MAMWALAIVFSRSPTRRMSTTNVPMWIAAISGVQLIISRVTTKSGAFVNVKKLSIFLRLEIGLEHAGERQYGHSFFKGNFCFTKILVLHLPFVIFLQFYHLFAFLRRGELY